MATPSERACPVWESPRTPTPVRRLCPGVSSPGPGPQRAPPGVAIRDLGDALSGDVAKVMAEEFQRTRGELLTPGLNFCHTNGATRALTNCLLRFAKGSRTLAGDIWEAVHARGVCRRHARSSRPLVRQQLCLESSEKALLDFDHKKNKKSSRPLGQGPHPAVWVRDEGY